MAAEPMARVPKWQEVRFRGTQQSLLSQLLSFILRDWFLCVVKIMCICTHI